MELFYGWAVFGGLVGATVVATGLAVIAIIVWYSAPIVALTGALHMTTRHFIKKKKQAKRIFLRKAFVPKYEPSPDPYLEAGRQEVEELLEEETLMDEFNA
jgi:hypothetical protein